MRKYWLLIIGQNYHSFARQLNMYGFKRTHMQRYLGPLVRRYGGEAKFWIHETLVCLRYLCKDELIL